MSSSFRAAPFRRAPQQRPERGMQWCRYWRRRVRDTHLGRRQELRQLLESVGSL